MERGEKEKESRRGAERERRVQELSDTTVTHYQRERERVVCIHAHSSYSELEAESDLEESQHLSSVDGLVSSLWCREFSIALM